MQDMLRGQNAIDHRKEKWRCEDSVHGILERRDKLQKGKWQTTGKYVKILSIKYRDITATTQGTNGKTKRKD